MVPLNDCVAPQEQLPRPLFRGRERVGDGVEDVDSDTGDWR